jgi:hypothetical protein
LTANDCDRALLAAAGFGEERHVLAVPSNQRSHDHPHAGPRGRQVLERLDVLAAASSGRAARRELPR